MNCQEFRAHEVAELIDCVLSDRERAERRHLESCPDCQTYFENAVLAGRGKSPPARQFENSRRRFVSAARLARQFEQDALAIMEASEETAVLAVEIASRIGTVRAIEGLRKVVDNPRCSFAIRDAARNALRRSRG